MSFNKDQFHEIMGMVKHMSEHGDIDIEAEKRSFFEKQEVSRKGGVFKIGIIGYQYAAILVLALFSVLAIYFLDNDSVSLSNLTFQEIATVPYGDTEKVVLPDGSLVWLNSGSELSYSNFSGNNVRAVFLRGEGYFEVVKNANRPFIVKIRDQVEVEVLGTTFNVKAYDEDDTMETSLLTGKVRLTIKGHDSQKNIEMVPGEKVTYEKNTNEINLRKSDDISKDKKWIEGKLVFDSATLKSIASELSRAYGVNVEVDDQAGKNIITATFNRASSIDEILKLLKISSNVNYEFNHGKWIISNME